MNWADQDQNDKWSNKPMYQGKNVVIEGDVRFGRDTSVWHNAVVRTESEPITNWPCNKYSRWMYSAYGCELSNSYWPTCYDWSWRNYPWSND